MPTKKKLKTAMGAQKPKDRFTELSHQMSDFKKDVLSAFEDFYVRITSETNKKINALGIDFKSELKNEIRGVRTLIEQLDKRFTDAMMPSQMTADHEVKLKDHSERIEDIENDVRGIKTVIKSKDS